MLFFERLTSYLSGLHRRLRTPGRRGGDQQASWTTSTRHRPDRERKALAHRYRSAMTGLHLPGGGSRDTAGRLRGAGASSGTTSDQDTPRMMVLDRHRLESWLGRAGRSRVTSPLGAAVTVMQHGRTDAAPSATGPGRPGESLFEEDSMFSVPFHAGEAGAVHGARALHRRQPAETRTEALGGVLRRPPGPGGLGALPSARCWSTPPASTTRARSH